jgi:hypothetical protein
MKGIDSTARIGFTQALTSVNTAAAMNSVHHWSP